MRGDVGARRPGRGAAAYLILACLLWQGAVPSASTAGRATVVAWPGQETIAAALAEAADRMRVFPGLERPSERPITILLASTRARFDSLTRRQLPEWSDGAAFPEVGVIVLRSDRPPDQIFSALRHELAHLALRWHAGGRLPLWFEEGYASVAAKEWSRFDALRLNWTLARGRPASLEAMDRALRGAQGDAADAYALATTAVLLLERWGGPRGLGPLLANAPAASTFDAALRATYGVTEADFEVRWREDLRSRYGWLAWGAAAGLFWSVVGAFVIWLALKRRRRTAARRAVLDATSAAGDDAPTP